MKNLIRNINIIINDVKNMKTFESIDQISADMEVVMGEIIVDLSKFKKNNKAAGARVRKYILIFNALGKSFKKFSI